MPQHNDKQKIRELYDLVSPYYQALWGEHIHHGYWIDGKETKQAAQLQLIDYLAKAAGISQGSTILDVGCGMGGSSVYLAERYHAQVTGITISPVQVEIASRDAAKRKVSASFLLMDAEAMTFKDRFDVVWSVESISHYQDVPGFFASAGKLLKPGGVLALTDWFKRSNLRPTEHAKSIAPIEESMLVTLHTMETYQGWLEEIGFAVTHREILNDRCIRTWDITLEILKDKKLWQLAARHGAKFVTHLRGFRALRAGFTTGHFVYGALVARKPS